MNGLRIFLKQTESGSSATTKPKKESEISHCLQGRQF